MTTFNQIQNQVIPSIAEFKIFYDRPLVNELKEWDYPNHFFSYFKTKSTQLVVMLQGAIDRTKMQLPVFQRWSWAGDINASVLILNDPTLFGNDLMLGWWQGEEKSYAIPSACELINLIIKKLEISVKDVLFFGSSAGGFSALMMAGHLQGSVAIVNNPQTNILEYREEHIQDFLQTKFRGMSPKEAFDRYPTRFSVSEFFKSIHYIPRIAYYQNVRDTFHFETQYLPLVKELYQSAIDPNEFQSVLYTHDWGHSPLERVKTVAIADSLVSQ